MPSLSFINNWSFFVLAYTQPFFLRGSKGEITGGVELGVGHRREPVGDGFLDEAHDEERHGPLRARPTDAVHALDLGDEEGGPDDRPGEQVRKERERGEKRSEAARRLVETAVDIDNVAHRLQGVEGRPSGTTMLTRWVGCGIPSAERAPAPAAPRARRP